MASGGTMRQFVRSGALVFVGTVSANALTYVSYATLARALGVEGAGLFTALVSAVLFLSLPSNVAGTVVSRAVASAAGRGAHGVVRYLGVLTSLSVVPVALLALLAATVANRAVGAFFHTPDALVVSSFLAVFAFTFPLALQRAVMQGTSRFRAFALSNVLEGFGKAATGVAALALGGGIRFALAAYAVTEAVTYGAAALAIVRGDEPLVRPRPQRADVVRHVVGIALPITALTAVTFADTVLVRHFLAAREAGLYGAAALVGRAIVTVVQFVPTVLLPRATAARVEGRSPAPFVLAAAGATALCAGGVVAIVAVAPAWVVTAVAGRAFADAAGLVLPYALAMTALAGAVTLTTYLIAIGELGFAVPVVIVAIAEIAAVAAYHPSAHSVALVVLAGHTALLACCLPETVRSVLRGARGHQAVQPPSTTTF